MTKEQCKNCFHKDFCQERKVPRFNQSQSCEFWEANIVLATLEYLKEQKWGQKTPLSRECGFKKGVEHAFEVFIQFGLLDLHENSSVTVRKYQINDTGIRFLEIIKEGITLEDLINHYDDTKKLKPIKKTAVKQPKAKVEKWSASFKKLIGNNSLFSDYQWSMMDQ